jgi:hypothetical protein
MRNGQRSTKPNSMRAGFSDKVRDGFASIVLPDADVSAVAKAIAKVVNPPFGKRLFRVHTDPVQDGAKSSMQCRIGCAPSFYVELD